MRLAVPAFDLSMETKNVSCRRSSPMPKTRIAPIFRRFLKISRKKFRRVAIP